MFRTCLGGYLRPTASFQFNIIIMEDPGEGTSQTTTSFLQGLSSTPLEVVANKDELKKYCADYQRFQPTVHLECEDIRKVLR